MPSFTSIASCQGITLNWGSHVIGVTRLSFSRSAPSETDVTGITCPVTADPNYSMRRTVTREVEFGVTDMGEISCDFFGPGTLTHNQIGQKAAISTPGLSNGASGVAFLTQLSTEVVAGDLVRGSCTFKLSANRGTTISFGGGSSTFF